MPIRKLTLEEWFLKYQLGSIRKRHFHLPVELNVDVTPVIQAYGQRHGGKPPHFTALIVKALALTARELPYINRMVFTTFYGERIVDFDEVTVNVPVILDAAGRPHLSAIMLKRPHERTLEDLRAEISESRKRDLSKLAIGKFFIRNRNTFLNRLMLRLIHFIVYNFPSLYVKKGGGGLTVSSLLNQNDGRSDMRPYAYGSTAFTVCVSAVVENAQGRSIMKLGVGYDHYAFAGNEGVAALKRLVVILEGRDETLLPELVR